MISRDTKKTGMIFAGGFEGEIFKSCVGGEWKKERRPEGTAPVSFNSGQIKRAKIRRHDDRFLLHPVPLWAGCSLKSRVWAAADYAAKRKDGLSHACNQQTTWFPGLATQTQNPLTKPVNRKLKNKVYTP